MATKLKRPWLIGSIMAVLIIIGITLWFFLSRKPAPPPADASPTPPPPPVNLIPVSDRPYVSLKPLSGRNDLEMTIATLPLTAEEVEVSLEYDRNEGVWDAVLKNFFLTKIPYTDKLFLGSKSTGGHITYHDDVVGGKITLAFRGGSEPYNLEVPWRYDDSAVSYQQFSTQDAKFQVESLAPVKTAKIVVMQSPGLPAPLEGQVLAGPYLIRVNGPDPDTTFTLQIRLNEESPTATLYGWDGAAWVKLESTLDGKTLTATSPYYESWVVVN